MPKKYFSINNFGKGINNVKNPRDLTVGEMAECVNWNVSKNGELIPRTEWSVRTNGSALTLLSNTVPANDGSLNPGYGLFYFEADDPVGVRGVTVTGAGNHADGTTMNEYTSGNHRLMFTGSQIFINQDDFWTTNNVIPGTGAGDLPVKIKIGNASNSANNGVFTVSSVISRGSGQTIAVSGTTYTMSANIDYCIISCSDASFTDEVVANAREVTINRLGFVGDAMLAVADIDSSGGKINVYYDSADGFTDNKISVLNVQDTNEKFEAVYYYSGGALRVADGNHRNDSTPKWFGHIERDQFHISANTVGTSIESNLYEENNGLAPPSDCDRTASGSLDGAEEYLPTGGTGWGLCVEKSTDDGEWEGKSYEFGGTFIYDGNQESLITKFSGGAFNHDDGKKFNINVYANIVGTSANGDYARRISGGRIYIREANSNDEWILFVDIDIKNGARVNLEDEYLPWQLDGTGEFLISDTTTHGDFDLKSSKPNLDSYETLNGFSPATKQIAFGQRGSGYKTAVVAGDRAFVANVKYDENNIGSSTNSQDFEHFGDRIMFSQIGRYDTFPAFNKLDVTKGDGEDYSCLAYYSDRLLAFKQRTLQILNIASKSPSGWFLETTVPYAGVQYSYSVANTEFGVVWANANGAYLFNGSNVVNISEGKIADAGQSANSSVDWDDFANSVVGYMPKSKQAIFIDSASSASDAFFYDFRYQSWYYGKDAAPCKSDSAITNGANFTPLISNMVVSSKGDLIAAYDVQSTDLGSAGAGKIHVTTPMNSEQKHKYYRLQTPDLDFGKPGNKKKVYAIYINYRHSGSTSIDDSEVEYMTNNSGTWTAFNATSSTIPQTHSSDKNYSTVRLPLADSVVAPAQSFAFRFNFDALNEDSALAINDITIEYRVLSAKAA